MSHIASKTNVRPFLHSQQALSCNYAGGCFTVSDNGVFFLGKDKEGYDLPPRWICAPLYVLAKTRDSKSGEWGRLLEWQDDDGVNHQWAMPIALLQGDAAEVRRELACLGLSISPNRVDRDLLASYLQVFPVQARARCVERLGWHGDVFVTANESMGTKQEHVVFQNIQALEPAFSIAGTVEDWRTHVARLARGNSRLLFAISSAFAPSLAALVGEESGGFHFKGASSCGKTTALKLAASVWGDPSRYTRLWRTTTNGLEGLAAMHNDGLLILDELSQIDPKEAGDAAYLLANGQGKTRALKNGMARPSVNWRLLFLSAGEESLSALMAKIGQKANAGQEIRLAEIEADAGLGLGMFENVHEYANPASFALALKDLTGIYYGAVGIEWLRAIVKALNELPKALHDSIQTLVSKCTTSNMSGQIIRVARRFALVGVAGELATHYGFTGWAAGEASKAARDCFKSWIEAFGATGNREDKAILSQVRAFFEAHGASRFDDLRYPNNDRIHHRAGFYRNNDNQDREYLVLSEIFKNEISKGFDPKVVIKILIEAGWLEPGKDGKTSQKPRIRGIGTPRCYVFTSKIWEDINCKNFYLI